MNKILTKLFELNSKFYCYDVSSNNIMEISEQMFDVLSLYNYSNANFVIENLRGKHPIIDLKEEIRYIDEINKTKGYFALQKDVKLKFPLSKSQYKKALDSLQNHIVLNLTENCNFDCHYCRFSSKSKKSSKESGNHRSMKWSIVKQSLDFLLDNSDYILEKTGMSPTVGFYGGEPLLKFDLIKRAVKYLKDKTGAFFSRFQFSMTTNGSLLSVPIIKFLEEYNFTLMVSLDGPEEIHDRYRTFNGGGCTYEDVVGKINLIKKISPSYFDKKVGFSIVLSPKFRLHEVANYFKTFYFGNERVYMFSFVEPEDTNFFEDFDMKQELARYSKDQNRLKTQFISNKINNKEDIILSSLFNRGISGIHRRPLTIVPDNIYPNGICFPGLQKVLIDPIGNLHFCEKINWDFSIGNVFDGYNIDNIFRHIEEYIKTTGDCSNCWALRLCKECFLSAIKDDSFSKEEKISNCKLQRDTIFSNMKDYIKIMDKNQNAFQEMKDDNKNDIVHHLFEFLGQPEKA